MKTETQTMESAKMNTETPDTSLREIMKNIAMAAAVAAVVAALLGLSSAYAGF